MTDRIESGSPLAREAILAALRSQTEKAGSIETQSATGPSSGVGGPGAPQAPGVDFEGALSEGLRSIQKEITAAEKLPEDILAGRVDDFHEVAIQLKRADVTFKFAMEIRNKLIDAYREIMRMSV